MATKIMKIALRVHTRGFFVKIDTKSNNRLPIKQKHLHLHRIKWTAQLGLRHPDNPKTR